jgi:hypothetical protein
MSLITCTTAILPTTIFRISRQEFILPKLAWVERREARHVSKLPLSPSNGGTSISKDETSWKTGQFWNPEVGNLQMSLWIVSCSIKTSVVRWCICCLRLWLTDWRLTYFPGESRRSSEQLLLTQQRKGICHHVNIGKSVQTWSTQATSICTYKTICLPGNLSKIYSVVKQKHHNESKVKLSRYRPELA